MITNPHRINPSFDAASLETMCTTSCTSSLQSYRANVVSDCAGYSMPTSNNRTYPRTYTLLVSCSEYSNHLATLAIDSILGPYNAECLMDP